MNDVQEEHPAGAPGEHDSTREPTEEPADAHRGFVREMNRAFSSVYGYGGAAVLAAAACVPLAGWLLGPLGSPLVWLLTVVVFLVGLFVLRIFVSRRAHKLYRRIRDYCEANDLPVEALRERYADDGLYPYFDSIFQVVERRRQLKGDPVQGDPVQGDPVQGDQLQDN